MKASVSQKQLKNAIGWAGRVISNRSTLPVLSNILITAELGSLKLTGTNLEIGTTIWIDAIVEDEGAITVPAKLITEFIDRIDEKERVRMELNERTMTLTVKAGKATVNIKGIDAADYPVIPTMSSDEKKEVVNIAIPTETLTGMIRRAALAASDDESRPTLTGIETTFANNSLTMAATDGYQLSIQAATIDLDISAPLKIIVPHESLLMLAGLCTQADPEGDAQLQITENSNQLICALEGKTDKSGEQPWTIANISTQLIDANYPNYRAIVPKASYTTAIVNTAELLKAFKLAILFARDNAYITRVSIESNQLTIAGVSAETGDSTTTLDAIVEGPDVTIKFNAKYIIAVLQATDTPEVRIELTQDTKPGVLSPMGISKDEQMVVVMPMHPK